MLPYENSREQYIYPQSFDPEASSEELYPPTTMDGYSHTTAYNNTLPFAFCPFPDTQTDDAYLFEMARTASNASVKHHTEAFLPALLPSASNGSPSSSTVGSPYSGHAAMVTMHENYLPPQGFLSSTPAILCGDDHIHDDFALGHSLLTSELSKGPFPSVDPNLLSGSRDALYTQHQFGSTAGNFAPSYSHYSNSSAPSPNPSHSGSGFSQNPTMENYRSFQIRMERGASESSQRSGASPRSSASSDEDGDGKGRCPFEECGRRGIKDMKAHMWTHQKERPEKCPIPSCPFNSKGFARKYDRNRHTLTHYKGTMVCGFCPGSGSSAEKSFNRADVFKRHLTTIHKVEQNPPNSRKRSPGSSTKKLSSYCEDATGKCSTCSQTFDNAQDFYEHLDDCVLRVVQQLDPREAVNARLLAEVASDPAVKETFDRHMIKEEEGPQLYDYENDDMDDMEDDEDEDNSRVFKSAKPSARAVLGGNVCKNKSGKKPNMTWSKIGVSLVGKGRRRRKDYPVDWGMSADKMKMKKRGIYVFDGPRRLLKDDMMLNNELEVRVKMTANDDSTYYVTDLDVKTLERAEAYHNATEEEKGPWEEEQPWIPEQDFITDLMA